MEYSEFFRSIVDCPPFDYQIRLQREWGQFTALRTPTGLGKTDAVLLVWLHRREFDPDHTPRRLVWCLPGRTLTEQAVQVIRDRVVKAGMKDRVRVLELMGGSQDARHTLGPDEPAILVGTQDLLVSRALNRGYARRLYRWPIDFALLNNDCCWVFDEVQLLGDALPSSTQLAAFRERMKCFGKVECCWVSATFAPEWLRSVDFEQSALPVSCVELTAKDREMKFVRQRLHAHKTLERAPDGARIPSGAASFAASRHRPGQLSLVVVNTIARARQIWGELERATNAQCVLLHSRFRAEDRASNTAKLKAELPPEGRIVVATQVIEAGIDISNNFMLTDVAPYASLVQRFGRVNRYGTETGEIFWVDRPLTADRAKLAGADELSPKEAEQVYAPYEPSETEEALATIRGLCSAAPKDLPQLDFAAPSAHVLRRADILDLFDTTPDLAGNDIDVSRFVRSGEDRDVYVAWRYWDQEKSEAPPPERPDVDEPELCPVPIGELKEFAKKHSVWAWDALGKKWARPGSLNPGLTLVVHCSVGGYTRDSGWAPESRAPVPLIESNLEEPEAYDDDRASFTHIRQTLRDHTNAVFSELETLLKHLRIDELDSFRADLLTAARRHDWGKAHPIMQKTLHGGDDPPYAEILAKSEKPGKHSVRFFRHELASALAMLQENDSDLAAYVAAAHHGRIRMSIRSMPGERLTGQRIARGVTEGNVLMPCDLGGDAEHGETRLRLGVMELGLDADLSPSWTDRMVRLRDRLGPFRLAYLEMLLRIADERASEKA